MARAHGEVRDKTKMILKRLTTVFGCIYVLYACPSVYGYEVRTHSEMANTAYDRSVLSNTEFLRTLGISTTDVFDRGRANPHPPVFNTGNIRGWIREGAVFEDGKYPISIKPLFHFFDPLHDDGLFLFTSPTWALEDKGKIHVLQNYSYGDARNFLYKALTASNEEDRKIYFGRTFESLGHVIHHIQDMAQPQHVRLDSHLNFNLTENELLIERRSRYELYTEGKATGAIPGSLKYEGYPRVTFNTARKFWHTESKNPKDGQGLAEFTNINFLSAGTNFTLDANGQPVVNARYGLPEWNGTTQEITLWKLLEKEGINCAPTPPPPPPPPPPPGDGGFPPVSMRGISHPAFAVSAVAPALVPAMAQAAAMATSTVPPACELNGTIVFYGTTVTDNYLGTRVQNDRASTLSIFDQDLEKNNLPLAFTLNRFNFKAAYPHLIPKAVAYSAGLIDYFFRGKIEIEDVSDDGTQLIIEIRNTSGTEHALKNGKFELYYDSVDGARKPITISRNAAANDLAHEAIHVLYVEKPPLNDVDMTKENPLMLVYKGLIGEEEGIATSILDAPFFSGFMVSPNYVPADGVAGSRHVYSEAGQWKLDPKTNVLTGNIDWKGWFLDNKPTKVLTWRGPERRYFGDDDFSNYIFQNGRLFAVTPYPVVGAALYKDARGKKWLIAICHDYTADIVYRRPYRYRVSTATNDLYDPKTNPNGWQEIGRQSSLYPEMPWFFNGSGTEAQTMRAYDLQNLRKRNRLKMSIVGDRAVFDDLKNHSGITVTATSNCPNFENLKETVTRAGSYVIAVDYNQDKEVLAIYEETSNYSREHQSSPASQTYNRFQKFKLDDTALIEVRVDGFAIPLVKRNRSGNNNASFSGPFTSGNYSVGLSASYHEQLSSLRFVDLRYNLYSIVTRVLDTQEQGNGLGATSPNSSAIKMTVSLNDSTNIDDRIHYRGVRIPIYNYSNSSMVSYEVFWNSSVSCFYSEYTYVEIPELKLATTPGAWVVDAQSNLLVSQEYAASQGYYDYYGVNNIFNYLTAGDLKQMILGGGDNAAYYPAYLVQ